MTHSQSYPPSSTGAKEHIGVDFTFTGDNNNNDNNDNDKNNAHLNFLKVTALGDKEQVVGIRDKGKGIQSSA